MFQFGNIRWRRKIFGLKGKLKETTAFFCLKRHSQQTQILEYWRKLDENQKILLL